MSIPASRITEQTMGAQTFSNLQRSLDRLQSLQEDLSSGKRVSRPSDDPASVSAAMRYRSELARIDQDNRSIDDAKGWLGAADIALQSSNTLLQRVRDLVLQGINGAMSPADRQAIAAEVHAIRDQLLSVANTKYLDRPIFGGATAGTAAYDPNGQFVGDLSPVSRTVGPGSTIDVAIAGPQAFGASPGDVFATLATIESDLTTSSPNLSTDINTLDQHIRTVLQGVALVGAREQMVESTKSRAADDEIAFRGHLSEAEDVDLPKTLMDLNLQQSAYQAALEATRRVLQPSLVDYLK